MGMDIYGLNPTLKSEKPEINWEQSTEQEKHDYIEQKDQFEKENPGYYFRANVWCWRPIAEIMLACNTKYKLGFAEGFVTNIHTNSGAGLKTQEECDILANHLETYISENFKDWNIIGLNTGWYFQKVVDEKGNINNVSVSDEKETKLELYLRPKLFINGGEFEVDGFTYRTSHNCSVDDVKDFINFLRECGGFKIL